MLGHALCASSLANPPTCCPHKKLFFALGLVYLAWPVQSFFATCKRALLIAIGQSRVALSPRQEHLRAACGARLERKGGPEIRPNY